MDSYNKLFMIIRKTDLLNYDEREELLLYLMNLKDQVKRQKEIIDKTKIFLENEGQKQYNIHDNYRGKWYSPDELDILFKILEDKEVSEWIEKKYINQ